MHCDIEASRAMQAQLRDRQPKGVWMRLFTELHRLSEGRAELVSHAERPWASATFSGTRHRFTLELPGMEGIDAGDRLIAELPDHEFALPGHLVADALVRSSDVRMLPQPLLTLEVELLLLDD